MYICRIPHLGEIVVAVSFINRATGSKGWASRITLEHLCLSAASTSLTGPQESLSHGAPGLTREASYLQRKNSEPLCLHAFASPPSP